MKSINQTISINDNMIQQVMHCKSTKKNWDKLQNIHEGDDKVKEATLQTHRIQFESLKMKYEENVVAYLPFVG
jgi:hypothetical protein